jgi:hypothetical protein
MLTRFPLKKETPPQSARYVNDGTEFAVCRDSCRARR